MPASPWIGSTRNATTSGSSRAVFSASASPKGTDTNPGVNGPKPFVAEGSEEKPTIVIVLPVEVPVTHDDLRATFGHALHVVAPTPRGLERGLDGLGAGVHRQHQVHRAQLGQFLAERSDPVVVERAGGERHRIELRFRRADHAGWRCPKFSAEYADSMSR